MLKSTNNMRFLGGLDSTVLAMAVVGLIVGAVLTITACVHKCKLD